MVSLKKIRVRIATYTNNEIIDRLYESSVSSKTQLEQKLRTEIDNTSDSNEKEMLIELADDDLFLADLTTELAEEMIIIALFKTLEISIKKMAIGSELFTEDEVKSFYNFASLKKLIKRDICDITNLSNYNAYNELRCINNCVKHSGLVSSELATFSCWSGKEGDKIENLYSHYCRLKNECFFFLDELQKQIINNID